MTPPSIETNIEQLKTEQLTEQILRADTKESLAALLKNPAITPNQLHFLKINIQSRSESKDANKKIEQTRAQEIMHAIASAEQERLVVKDESRTMLEDLKTKVGENIVPIAVGAATIGGFLLLKKLFTRGKEALEKGKEKVKRGIFNIWNLVLLGGIGLTGYLGWKAMTKKLEDMEKDFKDAIAHKGKAIASKADQLADKAIQKGKEVKDKVSEGTKKAGEITEKVIEAGTPEALARAIVFIDGDSIDWGGPSKIPENLKKNKIHDVMQTLRDKKVTMGQIFACVENGKINREKLKVLYSAPEGQADHEKEWHMKAAELFINFCAKQRGSMEAMIKKAGKNEPLEAMGLNEYLEQSGGTTEAFALWAEHLTTKGREAFSKQSLEELGNQMSSLKGKQWTRALENLLSEHKIDKKLFEEMSLQDLLKVALTTQGTIVTFTENFQKTLAEGEPEELILKGRIKRSDYVLYQICEKVKANPPNIAPFFHDSFPLGTNNPDIRSRIKGYFVSNMTIAQAMRFALFDQLAKEGGKGSPLGLALLQLETIHFSALYDTSFLNRTKFNIGLKTTTDGIRKILTEYGSIDIAEFEKITEELKEKSQIIAKLAAGKAVEVGTRTAQELAGAGVATLEVAKSELDKKLSKPVATTLVATGTTGTLGTLGLIAKRAFEKAATPDQIIKRLDEVRYMYGNMREGLDKLPFRVEIDDADDVRAALKKIDDGITSLRRGGPEERKIASEIARRFTQCCERNVIKSSWLDFAKYVRDNFAKIPHNSTILSQAEDISSVAEEIGNSSKWVKIIEWYAHPIVNRAGTAIKSVGKIIPGKEALKKLTPTAEQFLETLKKTGKLSTEAWEKLKSLKPEILDRIAASSMARLRVMAAVTSGKATEVAKVLRIAEAANGLKTVGNLAGKAAIVGGDILGVAMASYELWENQNRIANTDKAETKELYGEMYKIYAMQGGTSVAAVGILALYGIEVGMGTLAFGATSILSSSLGLTIWKLKQLEYAREKWSLDTSDWRKMPESQLFAKLEEFKPGDHMGSGDLMSINTGYGEMIQNADLTDLAIPGKMAVKAAARYMGFGKTGEMTADEARQFEAVERGNDDARTKICEALLFKHAGRLLPQNEKEPDANYYKRLREIKGSFVQAAMTYLSSVTGGKFDIFNPDIFLEAETHAGLLELATKQSEGVTPEWEIVDRTGQKKKITLEEYKKLEPHSIEQKNVIRAMRESQKLMKVISINTISELSTDKASAETKNTIELTLLSDITYHLSRLNGNIQSQKNGRWFSAFALDLTRYAAFQSVIQSLEREAGVLMQKKGEATPEDYEAALNRIKGDIGWDPKTYLDRGEKVKPDISSYRDKPEILTPDYIAAYLSASAQPKIDRKAA